MARAVAIVSGGMDSVTLAYLLAESYSDLRLLSFDYNQRHKKELERAAWAAAHLGAEHTIVDLTSVGKHLKGSALTDDIPVPEGHYAAPNMAITVVPNRNAIMLTIAYGIAVAEDAEVVAIGVHSGDHAVYPDCRPEFIAAIDAMQRLATEGFGNPALHIEAPFVWKSKADIVRIGTDLDVPYGLTWSCYSGREKHCGKCGTCVERIESFQLAGVRDPTEYEL